MEKPHYPVFIRHIDMNWSTISDYEYREICRVNSRFADWLFKVIAAQHRMHLTAIAVGGLAFLAGFGVCWLAFVR